MAANTLLMRLEKVFLRHYNLKYNHLKKALNNYSTPFFCSNQQQSLISPRLRPRVILPLERFLLQGNYL
jgi:hypothetical protein